MTQADADPEHRRRFRAPADFVATRRHAASVLATWHREFEAGDRFTFAVRDATTGELLGGCELKPIDASRANLSYWTYPKHRRRGFAGRAAALAVGIARYRFAFRALEVVVDADNLPSIGIARRLGAVPVGERNG